MTEAASNTEASAELPEPTSPSISMTPGTLLGIGTPGARALLYLFFITNAALLGMSIADYRTPLPAVAAFLVVSAIAPFLFVDSERPLPTKLALLIGSGPVLATAAISWEMPTHGWPGYASWHLGASTIMLFFLAMRGRIAIAWVSYLLMSAITIVWAVDVGQGIGTGIALTDRNAGVLLIGSLFGAAIGRLAQRIRNLSEIEVRRGAAISAEQVSVAQRGVRLERLEQMALPFLRRVAGGADPAEVHAEAVVLEGQLRDQVRAGVLAPALAEAVSEARARGIDVTLLDDLRDIPPSDVMDGLTAFVRGRLAEMTEGKLVVRLLPPGREIRATVLVSRPDEISDRYDFR
ncbi:hypothetical protein [Naasia lichenicola]|uniref:Uncharacterized protein n=1 Tax=Naasia lichenicola TaxID=2565933 RepID=A0A4S4FK93_9MICO|nr:hypothetical protein [Naasia lichenicola]THG30759.1 hypothetical protein E6C64_08965 [Naasia lichenicola]THG31996.1 hypothetical protein E6C64_08110 [Naasia lichenicola]